MVLPATGGVIDARRRRQAALIQKAQSQVVCDRLAPMMWPSPERAAWISGLRLVPQTDGAKVPGCGTLRLCFAGGAMNDRGDLIWWKSARSSTGNCVEIAVKGDHVYMRNSNDPSGGELTFDREVFRDFIEHIKETGNLVE